MLDFRSGSRRELSCACPHARGGSARGADPLMISSWHIERAGGSITSLRWILPRSFSCRQSHQHRLDHALGALIVELYINQLGNEVRYEDFGHEVEVHDSASWLASTPIRASGSI